MNSGIRFLVATDVHLGHRQNHPVRHNDSFEGFEEVMEQAKVQDVDFLLLGGDLFDEVNPSKECFFKCLNTLRDNVFAGKRSHLQVTLNGQTYRSNLDDPDLKISLPIFTIHGNHDYPSNDFGKISACDLLQASNYVNYFGKHLNLKHIQITPLIINKPGCPVRIALYGLGYIKDQILNDLFEQKKVVFEQPDGGFEGYLCIFVLHQNRYKKGFRAGAPFHQTFNPRNIPEWMALTIWGHQHEAIYKLETEYDRPIFQPGSTVLTSFIESEALKKQCLLVQVEPTVKYNLTSILLQKSFRPMKCLNFEYKQLLQQFGEKFNLFTFLEEQLQQVINEMSGQKKPIVRIKLQCTGLVDVMAVKQVQSKFSDRLANSDKILLLWKRKVQAVAKIEDKEVLNNIRNKKLFQINPTISQIDSILQSHTEHLANSRVIVRDKFLQMNNYLTRADVNPSEIINQKFAQMEAAVLKEPRKQLMNMLHDKQIQLNTAYKYYSNSIQLGIEDQFDPLKFHCPSKQAFENLGKNVFTESKFNIHCKMMQDIVTQFTSPIPKQNETKGNNSNQSNTNSRAVSAISSLLRSQSPSIEQSRQSNPKKKEEDLENSFESQHEVTHLEDQEDCCSRAQKTKVDADGNRIKFQEAEEKLKNANRPIKKKSALMSKPEVTSQRRSSKNVRFSRDFM